MKLSWEELVLILEGIFLDSVRRRKRYVHQKTESYAESVEK